jgi:hypothetical protein
MPDGIGDVRHARLPDSAGRKPGQTRGERSLVDHDHPPDDAEPDTEPAHILEPGIPYVRGWAHAARAAAALENELRACGLSFPHIRAEVNVFGVGIIELGRITPNTANALTALLGQARNASTAKEDTNHDSAA